LMSFYLDPISLITIPKRNLQAIGPFG